MKYLAFPLMLLFIGFSNVLHAQTETVPSNPNVRLGQKALLDGDFKTAAEHLEKAMPAESDDPNVLYMLGYAQYHSGNYTKALDAFGKVVELKPDDERAYYYKGRLNNLLAVQAGTTLSTREREALLRQAIADFTTGVSLNDEDIKLFQNRAVAYRDLGILLGTDGTDNYDKSAATTAYNNSVKDFERVLASFPDRKDIETEIKKAKVYRDNLK